MTHQSTLLTEKHVVAVQKRQVEMHRNKGNTRSQLKSDSHMTGEKVDMIRQYGKILMAVQIDIMVPSLPVITKTT
jgi:hypothetical protein